MKLKSIIKISTRKWKLRVKRLSLPSRVSHRQFLKKLPAICYLYVSPFCQSKKITVQNAKKNIFHKLQYDFNQFVNSVKTANQLVKQMSNTVKRTARTKGEIQVENI